MTAQIRKRLRWIAAAALLVAGCQAAGEGGGPFSPEAVSMFFSDFIREVIAAALL